MFDSKSEVTRGVPEADTVPVRPVVVRTCELYVICRINSGSSAALPTVRPLSIELPTPSQKLEPLRGPVAAKVSDPAVMTHDPHLTGL